MNPQLTSVASVVFKITPQSGRHRKQSLFCCAVVALTCLTVCYLAMDVFLLLDAGWLEHVYLLVS
jgi:hypothetical protein